MTKKKKIILLTSMVFLLVVTAVCNFIFTGNSITPNIENNVTTTANYFTQRRTERATSRNEVILQLDAIISKADTTSQAKESALKMKYELAENIEKELLLETLIKSQGFEDTVVIMGVDTDSINVVVKDSELTEDESIIIYTIINEETGKTPENVKIIPIY